MGERRADGLARSAGALKRRGLLAGAAALTAGLVAKLGGPDRVEAAHDTGGSPEALHAGVTNTMNGTGITSTGSPTLELRGGSDGLISVGSGLNRGFGVVGRLGSFDRPATSAGVYGSGTPYGVLGGTFSPEVNASGIKGTALGGATNGVWGENQSTAASAIGVYGLAAGTSGATIGIWGRSTSATDGATGTRGEATAPSGATTSVLGRVSSPAGIAVRGTGASGIAVFGGSTSNIGVCAGSVSSTGVFSTSTRTAVWGRSAGGTGVFGQATQPNGYGVYGAAVTPGWAGYFEGNVYVTGRVTQAGAAASMATAQDGTERTLYSQDSTEPLVEDVGEGTLVGGKVAVKLDPDFAADADEGAYHVVLTLRGDCNGLYVASQTPAGFDVRELKAGTASLPFSYRVVANRKGAAGKRLEKLERPKGLHA